MSGRPIETRYAGRRFRSRLEARWAVFFDRMGIKWDYETQGYIVDGIPYLPDFLLTQCGTWVEVKGDEAELDHSLMLKAARTLPEKSFKGAPGPRLLILGPIPEAPDEGDLGWIGLDVVRWWRDDVPDGERSFSCAIRRGEWQCECGIHVVGEPEPGGANLCAHLIQLARRTAAIGVSEDYVEDQWWGFGRYGENLRPEILNGTSSATPVDQGGVGDWLVPALDPYAKVSEFGPRAGTLAAAYLAARSARFEHGEKGAP